MVTKDGFFSKKKLVVCAWGLLALGGESSEGSELCQSVSTTSLEPLLVNWNGSSLNIKLGSRDLSGIRCFDGRNNGYIEVRGDSHMMLDNESLSFAVMNPPASRLAKNGKPDPNLPWVSSFSRTIRLGLRGFANARLEGGPSFNILDAGRYNGVTTLIGLGGTDVLIGGKQDSRLYGFSEDSPDGPSELESEDILSPVPGDYDHYYVQNNLQIDVRHTIYATSRYHRLGFDGNTIHFRESTVPVKYTLPSLVATVTGLSRINQKYRRRPIPFSELQPSKLSAEEQKVLRNALRAKQAELAKAAELLEQSVAVGANRRFVVSVANGVLQHLEGSTMDDSLTGNNILNTLYGGDGSDVLLNAVDVDVDVLIGGEGDDKLVGSKPNFRSQGDLSLDGRHTRTRVFGVPVPATQDKFIIENRILLMKQYPNPAAEVPVNFGGEAIYELRRLTWPDSTNEAD